MSEGGQETRSATGEVEVEAPVERVWRALTEARELERWFPLEAEVEPGPDGRIWMGWGHELGGWSRILAWAPPHHLRIAWVMGEGEDGGGGGGLDEAEEGSGGEVGARVTDYRLEDRPGDGHRTLLRVVTSGFPAGASWDDLVEGTRLGWAFELRQLKHYLERHDGQDRTAAFLRRRVGLPRREAWDRLTAPGSGVETLAGSVFDRSPPWQVALVCREPPDSLVRLTVDPAHDEPGARDVSVFISAWGEAGALVPEVGELWRRRLGRLFPEGRELVKAP